MTSGLSKVTSSFSFLIPFNPPHLKSSPSPIILCKPESTQWLLYYGWSARSGSTLKLWQGSQISDRQTDRLVCETEPALNQWYGYFRIHISDTGNDFSSIIRGLMDRVRHYSTFRKIETHGAEQVQMAVLYNGKSSLLYTITFLEYSAGHSTTEKFIFTGLGTAHSLKHHCTANMEVYGTTMDREQVLGIVSRLWGITFLCVTLWMLISINTLQSFHMNYLTTMCRVRQKPKWWRDRKEEGRMTAAGGDPNPGMQTLKSSHSGPQ